jgi:hypothetical protein
VKNPTNAFVALAGLYTTSVFLMVAGLLSHLREPQGEVAEEPRTQPGDLLLVAF